MVLENSLRWTGQCGLSALILRKPSSVGHVGAPWNTISTCIQGVIRKQIGSWQECFRVRMLALFLCHCWTGYMFCRWPPENLQTGPSQRGHQIPQVHAHCYGSSWRFQLVWPVDWKVPNKLGVKLSSRRCVEPNWKFWNLEITLRTRGQPAACWGSHDFSTFLQGLVKMLSSWRKLWRENFPPLDCRWMVQKRGFWVLTVFFLLR